MSFACLVLTQVPATGAPASQSPMPTFATYGRYRKDAVLSRWLAPFAATLAAILAACSPAIQSSGTSRQATSMAIRGYGVLGVEGSDLASMLHTCNALQVRSSESVSAADQDLRTRCDQLRRTMGTQPGNSVRAGS